jgi:hypothetical protein
MQWSGADLATSGVGRLPANPSGRLINAWLTSFRVTIDVTSYPIERRGADVSCNGLSSGRTRIRLVGLGWPAQLTTSVAALPG